MSLDFDKERELEDALIDAFEFSLMDEDERREALDDAGLDPDDFDGIEFDSSFSAWSDLQDHGLSLWELDLMDEDEKAETLTDAGLDPEDYEEFLPIPPASYSTAPVPAGPPLSPETAEPLETVRVCKVCFPGSHGSYSYLADNWDLTVGDTVIVPTGPENEPTVAKIVSLGAYALEAVPYPVEKMKSILRMAAAEERTPPEKEPAAACKADERKPAEKDAPPKQEPAAESCEEAASAGNRVAIGVILAVLVCVLFLLLLRQLYGTAIEWSSPPVSSPAATAQAAPRSTPRPTSPPAPRPTPRPAPRPTSRPTKKPENDDPFNAGDYSDPEDFYYDNYDDFWDYEDAEDYWEEHNG